MNFPWLREFGKGSHASAMGGGGGGAAATATMRGTTSMGGGVIKCGGSGGSGGSGGAVGGTKNGHEVPEKFSSVREYSATIDLASQVRNVILEKVLEHEDLLNRMSAPFVEAIRCGMRAVEPGCFLASDFRIVDEWNEQSLLNTDFTHQVEMMDLSPVPGALQRSPCSELYLMGEPFRYPSKLAHANLAFYDILGWTPDTIDLHKLNAPLLSKPAVLVKVLKTVYETLLRGQDIPWEIPLRYSLSDYEILASDGSFVTFDGDMMIFRSPILMPVFSMGLFYPQ